MDHIVEAGLTQVLKLFSLTYYLVFQTSTIFQDRFAKHNLAFINLSNYPQFQFILNHTGGSC